jgi:toxin YoeB
MRTVFSGHAWEEDIQRSPYDGIGKPEPLRHSLSGLWSRRIDDKNRLIYRCKEEDLELVAIGSHYGDH